MALDGAWPEDGITGVVADGVEPERVPGSCNLGPACHMMHTTATISELLFNLMPHSKAGMGDLAVTSTCVLILVQIQCFD